MSKKPWPTDAVMIVASKAGMENRSQMEGTYVCNCRECSQVLHADTATVRLAENHKLRRNRPVMFFCLNCASDHDHPSVVHDDRNRANPRKRVCPVCAGKLRFKMNNRAAQCIKCNRVVVLPDGE